MQTLTISSLDYGRILATDGTLLAIRLPSVNPKLFRFFPRGSLSLGNHTRNGYPPEFLLEVQIPNTTETTTLWSGHLPFSGLMVGRSPPGMRIEVDIEEDFDDTAT
jgi:hypothetical protein